MNYKQVFAIKAEREKRIKAIAPGIPNASGIYTFYRVDEAGIRRAYCGQAVSLIERCGSHLGEYDHIALSLKKHGFYSEDNPCGWKLAYKTCPREQLDELEVSEIKRLADAGYQMYNVTAGSQGKGKQVTGQYKQPKTYSQGVRQGRISLAKQLSSIAEKYLKIELRDEHKGKKVPERQFNKFLSLLKGGDDGNGE